MSLLNKASLIQIPSGYKDGTLYSAKPTNGDGDFTFSRGSNLAATRVNSDGLIEKGRENLLLQSNQFDTTWTTTGLALTSGQSDKDGGTDAWLLQSNNTGQSFIKQVIALTGVKTYSVFAKAGTADFLILYAVGGGDARTFFDLANGTTETESFNITNKIEDVGNGWYRCSLIFDKTISDVRLFIADSDGVYNSGNGSNIYIQDSQLELGLVATDYIETGASTAQAGILEDMPRLDYSGGATCGHLLLEPQRTNLFEYSEYFEGSYWGKTQQGSASVPVVTGNYAISPEGVQNATRVQFDAVGSTSSDRSGLVRDFAFTSGTTYSISCWVKATSGNNELVQFRVAGSQVGGEQTATDEWQLFTATHTATASVTDNFGMQVRGNNTTNESDILIYGMQLEQSASYASSYIPTYGSGSSVTRGADDAVATHTISDTETLTYYTEFIAPEQAGGGGEHLLENSSGSSRIRIYQNNSTSIRIRTDSPSANFDYSYSSLGIDVGDTVKIALSVDSGVMTAFINGVKKNTFSSATINFARLHLRPQTIITYNTGVIFNSALSDDECIQLTTL